MPSEPEPSVYSGAELSAPFVAESRARRRYRAGVRRRRRFTLAALAVVSLTASALLGTALALRPPEGRVMPGVRVVGIGLGGMEPEAAKAALASGLAPALERELWLVDGERRWPTTPRRLGCRFDLDASVNAALAAGRTGSLSRRLQERWQAHRYGLDLKPTKRFDRDELSRSLTRLAREANIPAVDARLRFDGRAFHITPEKVGRRVDVVETERNIVRYLDPFTHAQVTWVAADDIPAVRAAELKKVDARLASFTTRFNPNDVNRTTNLTLAARKLDGAVVPAGGIFSYNDIVGPRTLSLGYRVAKVFLKGEILDGVGGGVCQVSTTVYNAALEGRLPILERAQHSRPVTYAPPGRDAAVSYGVVDFKFRNKTDAPLLIQTRVAGNALTVSIYGNRRFVGASHQPAAAGGVEKSG